jgi:predicted acetyltransferase
MTAPAADGGTTISDFFVVRALRRTGVGREAARQAIAMFPGRWGIGFQSYNPGAQRFWSQVASDAAATPGAPTTTRQRRAGRPTPGSRSRPE